MKFNQAIIQWQKKCGRHDLPWQASNDPYCVWVSEIMLQQTQVATVLGYYQRFLARFPTVAALAQAPQDDVLAHWAGLGYYSRARNLHKAAQMVMQQCGGQFPSDQVALMALPGIGRSTAAAILAFSFQQSTPILDGNVKRVFCRVFGVEGDPGNKAIVDQLWSLATEHMPQTEVVAYTQGLMDLGATLCVRSKPRCGDCPVADRCYAKQHHLQAVLPQRKAIKQSPIRAQVFLLVRGQGKVLLQRQPAPGIWGGLFSLPRLLELNHLGSESLAAAYKNANATKRLAACSVVQEPGFLAAAAQWVAQNIGLAVKPSQLRFGALFTHAFTHYKLLGVCIEVDLTVAPASSVWLARDSANPAGQLQWFDAQSVTQVGLPKPIAQLALLTGDNH